MMEVPILVRGREIKNLVIVNTSRKTKDGKTIYDVTCGLTPKIKLEFSVHHSPSDGALRLVSIVAAAAHRKMKSFFAIPKDKIVAGAIKCSDIPKRYAGKLEIGVVTGTIIDGETALWVSDIEGAIREIVNGRCPSWD